ncbi:LAGLIDADG family homing endonuclease [Candidatus Nomurabacteria bacterium]|nr:LAGLIDADG family homing endonuclease [Candidatus Nomurabacteria bacterium]
MPKIIQIQKETLLCLYAKEFLSSYQIAKKLNCSQALVMKKLKIYEISTRTIQQGKALTKPTYERKDFAGTNEEKAYLVGFRLGDLYVGKTHPDSPTIRVSSNSTKSVQIDLIRELFIPYGHVKEIGPDKKGATNIRAYLNNTFHFLVPKYPNTPSWILKSKKYSAAFFAGYVDAEGTFAISNRNQPLFSIKSQDKGILSDIHKYILPKIGVKTRFQFVRAKDSIMLGIRSNKDVFGIFVYNRKDLLSILTALLPYLKHGKRKEDALKVIKLINHVRT